MWFITTIIFYLYTVINRLQDERVRESPSGITDAANWQFYILINYIIKTKDLSPQ